MSQEVKNALDKAMSATTGTINRQKAEAEDRNAKAGKDGPSFHQKERMRKDKMTDERMKNAEIAGRGNAEAFLDNVRNADRPGHDQAVKDFKNLYGGSEQKAREAIMKKTMQDYDCHPVENVDIAFEAKTLEANRPKSNVTATDLAHYDILKDALADEWFKRGYKGTKDVIDAWKAKYK